MRTIVSRRVRALCGIAAGAVVAGSALVGGGAPAASIAAPAGYEVVLTAGELADAAASGFAAGLKFVLDDLLFVGNKTLPQLVTSPFPGASPTIGNLINPFGFFTENNLSTLFSYLGLQHFTLGQIMAGLHLPDTDTVDEVLTTLHLNGLTLDQLLNGFGVGAGTTVAALVDKLGIGTVELTALLDGVGITNSTTVLQLLTDLNVPEAIGMLSAVGVYPDTTVYTALTNLDMSPDQTLGAFLGAGGFADFIGDMQLGQLLGFTQLTTLQNVVDELNWTAGGALSKLGHVTLGDLLTDLKLNPTQPLNELLSGLQVGPGAGDTLGNSTIGAVLNQLLVPGETAVPNPPGVGDLTPLADYITGIGLGQVTLDQLLGLS